MNFFQRRKILKRSNFLDLTPVRLMEHEFREEGKITLLMPRFKNKYWSRMLQARSKGEFIHIKLDESGSDTWMLLDGKSSVHAICEKLKEQFPEKLIPLDDTEIRVTRFLTFLYHQRYITFIEIQ
jgi:hypothetical protein